MTCYYFYHLQCENTQGTINKTCTLPQGNNVVVGILYAGDANCWIHVCDRAYANDKLRFSRYTTSTNENHLVCMAFQTRTMYLRMVTPAANANRAFNVTVLNLPIQERFQENADFRPVVGPKN